jgi:orotate phosphoribosyltransferase
MTESVASPADARARLRDIIDTRSVLRNGPYKLASGAMSDHFLDIKRTMADPEGLNLIADLVLDAIEGEKVDCVGGLELGAVPLAAVVSARAWQRGRRLPMFVVRKAIKDHGTQRPVEGDLQPGLVALVLEDVTTKGGSAMQAVEAVRAAGCRVAGVFSVVDRQEGAAARFSAEGIVLRSLFTWADFVA